MASKVSDIEFVTRILDNMAGKPNVLKARRIVKELGTRIRIRARGRQEEDFSQAAARTVREATEKV